MPTSLYLSVDNIHERCVDETEKVKVKEAIIPAYKVANAPEFVESQEFNEDNYLEELNSFASNNRTVIEKDIGETAKDTEVATDDNSYTYRADYAQIDTDNDNTLETTEGEYHSFTEDFEEAYESPVKDLVEKDIRDYSVPIDFYCDDYNRSEDSPKKSPFKSDRKSGESPTKSPFKAREPVNVLEPILEESKSSYGDDSGNMSEKRDSDAYLSAEIIIDDQTNVNGNDKVEQNIKTDTGNAAFACNKDPDRQINDHLFTEAIGDALKATNINLTEFQSNDGTDTMNHETNAASAANTSSCNKDFVTNETIIDTVQAAVTELQSNDSNVQYCENMQALDANLEKSTDASAVCVDDKNLGKTKDHITVDKKNDDVLDAHFNVVLLYDNVIQANPEKDNNEPVYLVSDNSTDKNVKDRDNFIEEATTDVLEAKASELGCYTNVLVLNPEDASNEPASKVNDDSIDENACSKDHEQKKNDHFIVLSSTDDVLEMVVDHNEERQAVFKLDEELVINSSTDIAPNEMDVHSGDKDFPPCEPVLEPILEESKSSNVDHSDFSEKSDSNVQVAKTADDLPFYVQPNDFKHVDVVKQLDDKPEIINVRGENPEEKTDKLLRDTTTEITRYVDNDLRIDNNDARKSSIEYSVSSFGTTSFNSTIEFEKYEAIADLLSNLLNKIDYDETGRDFFNVTETKRTKLFFDNLPDNFKQSKQLFYTENEKDTERTSVKIEDKPVIEKEIAQSLKNDDLHELDNEEEHFSITKMIQDIEQTINLNETILTETSDSGVTESFKIAESVLYYIFDRVFVDKKNKNKKRNNKKVITVVDAEDIIFTAVTLWPDENYDLTTDSYNELFSIDSNLYSDANIDEDINSRKVQNIRDKNDFQDNHDINLPNVESIYKKYNIEIQVSVSADIKQDAKIIAAEHKVVQAADQIGFEATINIETTKQLYNQNDLGRVGHPPTVRENVLSKSYDLVYANDTMEKLKEDDMTNSKTDKELHDIHTDINAEQNEYSYQEKYKEETHFDINQESLHADIKKDDNLTENRFDRQIYFKGDKYDEETNIEFDLDPINDSNVMDRFDYSVTTFRESDIEIVLNNPKEFQHTTKYHKDDYSTTDDEECKELSDNSIEIAEDIVFEIFDHVSQSLENKTYTQNGQNYEESDEKSATPNHDDVQGFEKRYADTETCHHVEYNMDFDKTYNVPDEKTNFQEPPNKSLDLDQDIETCTNETMVDNDKMNTAFVHNVFCSHASSPRQNLKAFDTCDESPIKRPSTSFVGQELSLYNKDDTLLGSPFVKQAAVISMSLTENSGGIKYWLSFDDSVTEPNDSYVSYGRRSLRNTEDVVPSFYGINFEKADTIQRSVLVNDIDKSVETPLIDRFRIDDSIEFPNFSSSNTSRYYDTCESNDDSVMQKFDSPQDIQMQNLPEDYDFDNSDRKLLYEVHRRRDRLYTTWPPFEDTLFYRIISKFRMSESFDSSELDRVRIDSL